jgi:methionyl-tRNA synthetase
LKEAMNMARLGNKYLADTEPWKLAKSDMERVASILHISLQLCANLCIAFEPFLPFSATKLLKMLQLDAMNWDQLGKLDLLHEGHQLGTSQLLFNKIEDEQIAQQMAKLEASKQANELANKTASPATEPAKPSITPQKELVTFDDFGTMDIRTVSVIAAERVPKTDKLLKLTIDTGVDTRTIVSGIAQFYTPEELVGKQVCVLINLAPRKIKGIESQGMILMARNSEGKMTLVQAQSEIENGSEIG